MGAIVGRRSELERVERFLGAVEGGVHGLLLEGEPGIGKTRIWAEGLERARARAYRVLVARPGGGEARSASPGSRISSAP